MMSIQNLIKQYPKTMALKGVDVSIPRGKITGLVGPNGSGKTTLIQCILEHISYEGEVRWNSNDPSIFFIPDENILPDLLSGYEYLIFIENIYGIKNNALKQDLLERYDMVHDKDKMIQSYSYGMKKKIQLIAALMVAPDVLILDEIFRGLDIEAILNTKQLLVEFALNGGTILLSSHDILAVEQMTAHIVLLIKGDVKAQGSPAQLCDVHAKESLEEVFVFLNA